ncbi:hypothetical protein PYS58_03090 [Chryseobacterium indologenes]|uniref:hypothetical protein n=1 Tax=Chryseobacterium TaxID=59732 RepID=UPI00162A4F7B|nr:MULTISPECIES: hypothetical protein [Chryseobacterium]MDM1555041.1 hypothetical protein [Chryseobacterium indologenes]WET50119.1 hypothetical protein PYS58_03090 [Chryseobacterium indologenes]
MKKLLILLATATIVWTVSSCSSERDENITPKDAAMKMDANLNKKGLKTDSIRTESSTSKLTSPIEGDNPDETIDPTKPDRPR